MAERTMSNEPAERELPNEPCVFQVPLSVQPQQPWAKHARPTAWFNQGLNAETWSHQAAQQNKLRHAKKTVSSVEPTQLSQ